MNGVIKEKGKEYLSIETEGIACVKVRKDIILN